MVSNKSGQDVQNPAPPSISLRARQPLTMLCTTPTLTRKMQGAEMWFWLAGGIVFTVLVLVFLRLSSAENDLGAVSDGWLARHRADRRSSDF